MPRSRRDVPWPATMAFALLCLVFALVFSWTDLRLDRDSRSVPGRLLGTEKDGKGHPFGEYGYRVDEQEYAVRGSLTSDASPTIDYSPASPSVARLHRDADQMKHAGGMLAFFGILLALTSLSNRRQRSRADLG